MEISELEQRVAEIRAAPLRAVCLTSKGKQVSITVRECVELEAKFLYVDDTELDTLLGAELGGDNEK